MELRERVAEIFGGYLNDLWDKDALELADAILDIPEIKEARAALEREESHSNIYDDPNA